MALNLKGIMDAVVSHAKATGHFEQFAGHDFKSAPGEGVWGSIFLDAIDPMGEISGLNAASVRVAMMIRITQNMLAEPQDDIDPTISEATDVLVTALLADATLGGRVRNIDVFGETGDGLSIDSGYVEIDRKYYRTIDVRLPMIVNDAWSLST